MNKQLFSGNNPDVSVFFNFSCAKDVFDAYAAPEEWREDVIFIYADYESADYEGSSHVIFMKGDKLYEVNGSHCSCNGLEECWSPEETSFAALMFRPNVSDTAKKNLKKAFPGLVASL